MPNYQYVARTYQGKMVTGRTEAPDEGSVAKILRDQGLIPTSIELGAAKKAKEKSKSGRGGAVRLDDICIMSRQFATMIRAGLPLIEVLNILKEQSEKRQLQSILGQIERDVQTGSSLTEACEKHPKVFSTFYCSMIKAGEASGMLDSILDQVAVYLEKTASIRRKVKSAVMYPAIVLTLAVFITVFLMVKIVPVFVDIFKDLGGELPTMTRITVATSNFLQENLIISTIGFAVIVFGIIAAGRTKGGRELIDRVKLSMPVFGPIFMKVAVARFTRTLGVLIRAGVNILNALDITARTASNVVIERAVYKTRASIQSGESIAGPLRESDVFPPMVVRMIDVGERTGALESMLGKIADFYEDQVDAAVAGLTALIEPLLIVFLGLIIGFIAISMFVPMLTMVNHI